MARERSDFGAPLLGSALLHAGLAAAVLVSWPWLGRTVQVSAAVPVTIVARGPVANVRPAEPAPVEAEALAPEPEPEAAPEPPAPPQPEPKAAQPTPKPKPKAPEPKPKARAPEPKAPALDLDALEKSLGAAPRPKSSARKGAVRAETSTQSRAAAGEATELVGSFLNALQGDLSRRWNPNCEVEGGRDVNIEVRFRLDSSGRVVGGVEATGERSSNNVVRVAADRAKRAVREAEPFHNLPAQLYDERLIVRFDARTACASG